MPQVDITNGVSADEAAQYFSMLQTNIAAHGNHLLEWVPQNGDYQGNGENDAWTKLETLYDLVGGGEAGRNDKIGSRSDADGEYLLDLFQWYKGLNLADDPLHLIPDSHADEGGLIHDFGSGPGASIAFVVNHLQALIMEWTGNDYGSTNVLYDILAVPFIGIADTLYSAAQDAWTTASEMVSDLWDAASGFISDAYDAITDMWGGFSTDIGNFFDSIGDSISGFFSDISSAWDNFWDGHDDYDGVYCF